MRVNDLKIECANDLEIEALVSVLRVCICVYIWTRVFRNKKQSRKSYWEFAMSRLDDNI